MKRVAYFAWVVMLVLAAVFASSQTRITHHPHENSAFLSNSQDTVPILGSGHDTLMLRICIAECDDDSDCNDGNPCTVDTCVSPALCGTCSHTPVACPSGQHCENGQCVADSGGGSGGGGSGGGGNNKCQSQYQVCRSYDKGPLCDKCNCEQGGGSWGGCSGDEICCLPQNNQPYEAACDDPPGGGRHSVCRAVNDGTSTIPQNCYCHDEQNDQYVVGDCVTAGET